MQPAKIKTIVQHTPGPWSYDYSTTIAASDEFMVMTKDVGVVAWVVRDADRGITNAQVEANARLISAAPDLLAALQGLMGAEWRPKTGPLQYDSLREEAWATADAAIARAQGRES